MTRHASGPGRSRAGASRASGRPVRDRRINTPPSDFDAARDLPGGFPEFYARLHAEFMPRRDALVARRHEALRRAHEGVLPDHLPASGATTGDWRIALPDWCRDQRNQMTGPADDAELVVKMLNSGAPGVMLDLEDSMANTWSNLTRGIANVHAALEGTLAYDDRKRDRRVGIEPSATVVWVRPRGLHISQHGIVADGATSASLFDVARVLWGVEPDRLRHPPCIYIPKSESADEGLWWRDVFRAIARARGWPEDTVRCMALVEAHPLAYQMEEFLYGLRDHIVGLNLGRWDYMASLIHYTLEDSRWVLPDRNTIPHDVPFFQRLRTLLVELCHRRGALAIGGMTALYPSREDAELNARALEVLERDKRNEAECGMDGAWTGHPDQNAIAVAQFPAPNQIGFRPAGVERYPDLRPTPNGVGTRTVGGTHAAVRTAIRYRHGVLGGRGASLLDGYMEDLATDRIYRLMIAQRMAHPEIGVTNGTDEPVPHTERFVSAVFDQEVARLIESSGATGEEAARLRLARDLSETMIREGRFDPA